MCGEYSSAALEHHNKITRHLVDKGAFDAFDEEIDSLCGFRGRKETFQYLQQNMYPSYYNWDTLHRIKVAQSLETHQRESIEMMRMAISQGTIDEEVAACVNEEGNTFLHCVARGFGTECSRWWDKTNENEPANNAILDSWPALARELITAGAPLHSINGHGFTPLSMVIYGFLRNFGHTNDPCTTINNHINLWISCLGEAGVDLRQYGETERELQFTDLATTTFEYFFRRGVGNLYLCVDIRFIGFSYGPRPEDWHFWFSEPPDPFAGEFWEMVERTSLEVSMQAENAASFAMPGSWVEQ